MIRLLAGKRKKHGAVIVIMVIMILAVCSMTTGCSAGIGQGSGSFGEGSGSSAAVEIPGVEFSKEAGAYAEDSIELELSAPKGFVIYYTTDGSVPTTESNKYEAPITMSGPAEGWLDEKIAESLSPEGLYSTNATPEIYDAWVIRAAAADGNGNFGPVVTKTYFPGTSLEGRYNGVAVISVAMDPADLLDYEKGILVRGKIYDDWMAEEDRSEYFNNSGKYYLIQGNFSQKGKEWERPANIEIFDGSDTLTLSQDCGLRLHGSMSRIYPHRSVRFYFKEDYGKKNLDYPILPDVVSEETDETIAKYKSIVLRNGGNLTESLMFKDSWQQSLLSGRDFVTQHCRPAVLYLNGEYWGAYTLNERYTDSLLEEFYGADDPIIVKEGEFEDGNEDAFDSYTELMTFAEKDLSDPDVWSDFSRIMNVRGMAEYLAAQVYMGNGDINTNKNILLWRDAGGIYDDGKWQYMLYDTDFTSEIYLVSERVMPEFDSVSYLAENYPLFGAALRNYEFRTMFIDALEDIGSNDLSEERVNETLDAWAAEWRPLAEDTFKRFFGSMDDFDAQIQQIKDFYANRYYNIVNAAWYY
ncbi:MAG: CotH kinase family protein [Eubacterium sp.]|nr:CotH kinase family protein [Eubacterium sp.]